ncbi:MAG: hypothetical protein U0821_00210 [Chloroflexota bacterium]
MIGKIIKRILHRTVRGVIMRPVRGAILLGALLIAAGVAAFQAAPPSLPSFGLGRLPGVSLGAFRGATGAPAATESYIRGHVNGDAELVWAALGDEALNRYRSRGVSAQSLQSQFDQAKQAGAKFESATYVGGESLPDGTSMHFYVAVIRSGQTRGEADYIPYVFTLDRGGKINQVQ